MENFIALDTSPEGLIFIPADQSGICAPVLGVANALSGSSSFFKIGLGPPRPASEAAGSCFYTAPEDICAIYASPPMDVSECPVSPGSCVDNCGALDVDGGCFCDVGRSRFELSR